MIKAYAHIVPVALSFFVLSGCGHETTVIREYDEVLIVPPEPAAAVVPTSAPSSPGMPQEAGAKPLTWQAPAGWQEEPGSGMRLATFRVDVDGTTAECSIVSLAGDAGGLVPNVRRWIGQLGLDTPPTDELTSFLSDQPVITTAGGHEGMLIDLTDLMEGHPPSAPSMLAGIITRGGQTVFVKLSGTKAVLAAERERFEALCASLD